MAHKAKDGTEYTNRMMVNKHNARMDSGKDDSSQQSAPPSDEQSSPQSEDVDQHVDALLASGMSPDDIHEAAKKRSGASGAQEMAPARTESSLSSIPGM